MDPSRLLPLRFTAAVAVASIAASLASAQSPVAYPKTRTVDVVETLHGERVADPYRWMEEIDSPEVKAWIEQQNALTFSYLAEIPAREPIKRRLTQLWNYERYFTPSETGGKYFFSRNDGLQNQNVLLVADSLDATPRVLINPNTLSADGTVALGVTSPSEDGKLLAYGVSTAGSDWVEFRVKDVATGNDLPETLKWIKFSGVAWMKDGSGFFYSRYDEPKEGNPLTALNKWPKLYFHKIGEEQSKDRLVYERPDEPDWSFGATVSEDGRFLVLSVGKGTERKNRVFFRDVSKGADAAVDEEVRRIESASRDLWKQFFALDKDDKAQAAELTAKIDEFRSQRSAKVRERGGAAHGFIELLTEFDAQYSFAGNDGGVFYFYTDNDAPRGRVIAIDASRPARENWREVIAQSEATLRSLNMLNDQFLCVYLKDAYTQARVFDLQGKPLRDVDLPGIGTAGGFGGRRDDTETFYSFTGFTTPGTIYRYDLTTGKSTLWRQPKVEFNPADYETRQVFYPGRDGTKIPLFIVHRKDLKMDGSNPTYLYGYGGFNQTITPTFSVSNLVLLEMGGVYASACIRGGGEYGKDWHNAGRLRNKQNCFDDFCAAAEWLIANKYTRSDRLAIGGGSNGGLLVGACVTQRPELFGAALPAVGVMDMLRFHKFTIGWAWTSDYGSPDDPEMFPVLRKYSPYHNIRPGVRYPATMVTTGDHDDRVVPSHSFKYAAAIQSAAAPGSPPQLIRIETRAGHGAGKPTTKLIEEAADRWAFLVRSLDWDVSAYVKGIQ